MPIVVQPTEMRILRQGEGWKEILIANHERIGEAAMVAHRWSFAPGAIGPQIEHGDCDELIYVISGGGLAMVGEEQLPLEPESVLWLELGDRYTFQAGPEGLEILQGYAPET